MALWWQQKSVRWLRWRTNRPMIATSTFWILRSRSPRKRLGGCKGGRGALTRLTTMRLQNAIAQAKKGGYQHGAQRTLADGIALRLRKAICAAEGVEEVDAALVSRDLRSKAAAANTPVDGGDSVASGCHQESEGLCARTCLLRL